VDAFTFDNPVFRTYVIAAALAILKMLFHAFLVVSRMIGANGGFLNPEDRRKTFGNPNPSATQTDPNESVERARRMHRNEGENTPLFLAAGLIFVAAAPPLWLADVLLYGYVAARFAHFWAYGTAQNHEIRATFFTLGALAIAAMATFALYAALTH
jgi:glutathione S-transferase